MPHAVEASYQLMLEDHVPPFQPDDAISYHLEARDGKGQTTSSEIGFILVGYYEHWSTWGGKEAFSLHQAGVDLMSLLHLTWQLDSKKSQLQPADFQKQAQDIASQLVGPDGTVVDFLHLAKISTTGAREGCRQRPHQKGPRFVARHGYDHGHHGS